MANYKVLSHVERLQNPKLNCKLGKGVAPEYVDSYKQVIDIKDGVKMVRNEVVKEKLADRDAGLKWYDFSIDSLTVSGAIADAKFSQLNVDDRFAVADSLDGIEVPVENDNKNIEG